METQILSFPTQNKIIFSLKFSTILLILFTFSFSSQLKAQTNEECISCHSDSSLTMEKAGKTVSLFINSSNYESSVHGKQLCIKCHIGFDATNIPHKSKIEPINCFKCHREAPKKHTVHKSVVTEANDKNLLCKKCHGTHYVQSLKDLTQPAGVSQIEACGECHQTAKASYIVSSHYKALETRNPFAPQCMTCHSKRIVLNHVKADSIVLRKNQELLCINCHIRIAEKKLGPVSAEFIKRYEKSVHGLALSGGNTKAAICTDCHGKHENLPISDVHSPMNRFNVSSTCGKCHTKIQKEFDESIHGIAALRGTKDAPICINCHGEHELLSPKDPRSRVSKLHVSAEVCTPCHSSVQLSVKYGFGADRSASYDDSFHGLANKGGQTEVANCASCHGIHNIKPSTDTTSMIHKNNLAQTCGQCHPGANQLFTNNPVHILPFKKEHPIIYFVSTAYTILIIFTVGGMFFHNLIDFYRKSKRRLMIRRGLIKEEKVGHGLYVRMTLSERLQHGSLLISFITLVVTGFMLRFPDAFWVEWIRSFIPSLFEIRSLIHRYAAVILIAASVYHLYYIFFVPRGKQLIRDLLPRIQDLYYAIGIAKYNLGFSPIKPELGRFSYIEKAEYWALIWGTIVMGVTGFILWFDNYFLGLIGKLAWDVARTIHFFEAILAALSIVVWHFYFVIFNPDIYPMNLAWLKGTITEEEMHDEHPLELKKLKEDERKKFLREQEQN